MEKKYKSTDAYHNNAMDGFSGIGEENHISPRYVVESKKAVNAYLATT